MLPTGYDLILRDAVMWPSALLGDLLQVPTVEVIPLPLTSLNAVPHSIPNPIAYIPQLGTNLTPDICMVRSPLLCILPRAVAVYTQRCRQLPIIASSHLQITMMCTTLGHNHHDFALL